MKYLIVAFLILLIGCQNKPEIDSLVYGHFLLLDRENTQLIEDIYVKTISNPEKYKSLKNDMLPLIEKGQLIENDILTKEMISDLVFDNSSDYLSSFIDMINDQDAKTFISKQKEDWVNHLKSRREITPKRRTLLLSQLKAIENFTIRAIISEYHINEYAFNKLYPVVIENKKALARGEIYTANIVMAGIDTTLFPIIKINEKEIPINEKGQGVIKIQTNKIGTFNWTGVVKLFDDDTGLIRIYPIEGQYKVK